MTKELIERAKNSGLQMECSSDLREVTILWPHGDETLDMSDERDLEYLSDLAHMIEAVS